MNSTQTIGFIGLGNMGKPMARRLVQAGYPLLLHSRRAASAEELLAQGARWAETIKELAQASNTIIMMLPDPQTVEQVALGEQGVLASAQPGTLVVDMGTGSPHLARRMAAIGEARGLLVLDAPVSGGQVGAENGTLSIMAGGRAEAFERALPLLHVFGPSVIHMGEAGAGQVTKACNQVAVALGIQAVAEALALAIRAGVSPARVRQALMGGFAASRVLELHGQRMIDGNLKAGGRVRTHHKDLLIALELAEEVHAQLPLTRQVDEMFEELMNRGYGDDDHSALVRLLTA